ncbi:MAG: crossover junction endodeoxyribonuclease RuvC [Clostridia bacterium]|nr:crossover junction endodeoxyribonuclease RuvC [Clostridia bacterium]
MIIIGIDPGYAIVGYGVIEYKANKFRVLDYGAITTSKDDDLNDRLLQIYNHLCNILDAYNPDALSIEKLFFNTNATTAIGVAQARGVCLLAAKQRGLDIAEYTPLQVKQAVTGYGKAVKQQVQEMTRMLLGLQKVPKPDDTADALAMAICHAHSAGSLTEKLRNLR